MDFLDLCLKRESCRDFTGEPVSREELEKIAEAGRLAPSACNSQPWRFYIVSGAGSDSMRKGLQWFSTNKFTDKATAFIVIAGEKPNYPERVGQAICGRDFSSIDVGIAAESMALCATSIGLGSCIIGGFNESKVKEAAGIGKKDKSPVRLVLAVGRPANPVPREKKRKKKEEVIVFAD